MANGNDITRSVFDEFIGHEIKVPYRDGDMLKVARGTLLEITRGFLRINGELGTIIINEKNVEKMSKIKK